MQYSFFLRCCCILTLLTSLMLVLCSGAPLACHPALVAFEVS